VRLVIGRRKETLSHAGLRLIIDRAEIIHEGESTTDLDGTHYYGSTLLSLDLAAISEHLDRPPDEQSCLRLADHLRASPFFKVHLMRLARRDVHRKLGSLPLVPLRGEMSMRSEGTRLLVDLDVEVHGLKALAVGGR
jgi:hypothetical protein